MATRAIHKIVFEDKLGIAGEAAVYLDVTHIPREVLDRKLEGILEIYEKFVGYDPREEPMKVFPAMHYTMGGLWVDNENQATNIPGIYAAGECEYQYHGANRLGANSLVSCIYGGMLAGPAAVRYSRGLEKGAEAVGESVYEAERTRQREANDKLLHQQGSENPITIWKEMGYTMTENVTVIRYNKAMEATLAKLDELDARYKKINLSDRTQWANQTLQFARELENMLILAQSNHSRRHRQKRNPRRALQARLPRTRRQELAEDNKSQLQRWPYPARVRTRRHFAAASSRTQVHSSKVGRVVGFSRFSATPVAVNLGWRKTNRGELKCPTKHSSSK